MRFIYVLWLSIAYVFKVFATQLNKANLLFNLFVQYG